ncbi:MAG: hypothetical protein EOS21_09550 [Mesorhizobium sp.]|nr:MAG: hypothetical protein EOS21_09550 [Mesorhizobium sp.]
MHSERLKADAELAEKKYLYERALADWERKTELAENVLAGFYKARAIFKAARHPFSTGNEGSSREKPDDEKPSQTSRKNAIYAPYERLKKEIDFFTDLTASRYRFSALFGAEGDEPFSRIVSAFNEVQNATFALLADDLSPSESREMGLQAAIGWVRSEDDKIAAAIDQAVAEIERLCRPILLSQPR